MESVAWDVIPPERRAGIGTSRPCGSLRIETHADDVRYVTVPAMVASAMQKKKESGELDHVGLCDLNKTIEHVQLSCAKKRIGQLASRRDYSIREAFQKLLDDGFGNTVARNAIEWATEVKLLDNKRFADSFVRSKLYAGWGLERIHRELQRRGIDVDTLEGWPYEYCDPDEERSRAYDVACRKRVNNPNAYAKLVRFLVGRGFSYAISTDVAREVLDDRESNAFD